MNRLSVFYFIIFLAAVAASAIGAARWLTLEIERRSIADVQTLMNLEGFDWVFVSADGLQVILEGTAPTEADNFRAYSLAGRVVDARRVVNDMGVAAAIAPVAPQFSLDVLRNDDGLQLIGLIPAETGRSRVLSTVEGIMGDLPVTEMVETSDFPAPSTWDAALRFGLQAIRDLPRSKVTIYDNRVEVQAAVNSEEDRARLSRILQRRQPSGVEIVLDITAPRPVITPFAVRFVMDGPGHAQLETCAAGTTQGRDRLIAAARAAGAPDTAQCVVGLGVPSSQWVQAVELAIQAVQDLGQGSVTFTDADVVLVGNETLAQSDFDRVIGELDVALPDVFSLQGVLPRPENAQENPPQFFATLAEDGTATLRGRIPGGAVGRSISVYAQSVFGHDNTDIATRSVEDLPVSWAVRTMVGLQALSRLNDGNLTVEGDTLAVRGRTGDADASSEITRFLAQQLGARSAYEVDVTYVEDLDPVASLPTPEECVAQIQAIQEDNKITFDPGSVQINQEAGLILDRIAEILPNCRHVRMEISGHTDSQGREQMNLGLSQSRAEAVLNGLLARRVLVSNLTAQGYGESDPIASNETEEGRERNRRIEFRLLSEAALARELLLEENRLNAQYMYLLDFRPTARPDDLNTTSQTVTEDADPPAPDPNSDPTQDGDAPSQDPDQEE
jgi:OOP family OmpA-OmpF porin